MRSNPHFANHPIDQEEVMAYLDGELPVEQATAVAAHLGECGDCQRLAADLKQVSEALVAWEIEPSSDQITPALATVLDRSETKEAQSHSHKIRQRFSSLRKILLWVFGVPITGLVALLVVWITLSSRSHKQFELARPSIDRYSGGGMRPLALEDRVNPPPTAKMESKAKMLAEVSTSLSPAPSLATRPPAPMIARTAEITITGRDFAKTRAALDDLLRRHQGYMGQLNVLTPTEGARSLTATLRVPADQLDPALGDLRTLGRVQSESQSGEEVSAQYVDLEVRLQNARNTEQRLTALLSQRTGTLSDVLEVETESSRVRGEIESMEAEKKLLDTRITFATLNVTIFEEFKAQMQVVPDSMGSRFRNAAIDGYQSAVSGLITFLLFLVAYGPSLLLWTAIVFLPIWLLWKRGRRKKNT
jgi:Domain of unknown function (DUF4349)/Putative zinc-finger